MVPPTDGRPISFICKLKLINALCTLVFPYHHLPLFVLLPLSRVIKRQFYEFRRNELCLDFPPK